MLKQIQIFARCVAPAMLLVSSKVAHATSEDIRPWTQEDVLSIPHVTDTALAADGRSLAYILRVANRDIDRTEYELHVTDFLPGGDRVFLRSPWIDHLQTVPGRKGWSFLADRGMGVQLYGADEAAQITSIVVNPETVLVGSVDGGEFGYGFTEPVRFGVAYYDWSPDGRRLFYSLLRSQGGRDEVRYDEEITRLTLFLRRGPAVTAQFFVKEEGEAPSRIADVPGSDIVGRFLGGMPAWHPDALDFSLQTDDLNTPHVQRFRWRFDEKRARPLDREPTLAVNEIIGPNGGSLIVERDGVERRLRERLPDGQVHDYGTLDARLSDRRSPGHWLSPDRDFALVAIRYPLEGRYGLVRIERSGRLQRIEAPQSLTHCSFPPSLTEGVCIREGIVTPPQFVRVTTRDGLIEPLQSLSAAHERITPLRAESRDIVNAYGFRARNYVLFPRGYVKGRRYPAILVTHSTDADERFGAPDFQWHYPVQLFAERGYVVILANEPYPSQSVVLEKASADRNICGGETSPAQIQRLGWFNQIESFRGIIDALVSDGIVDAGQIGIAGYSYGSQIANVAVTQTTLFKAASSGDGGFLEPTSYRTHRCAYKAIYGGAPGDPTAQANYAAFAPSYRGQFAQAPVLQQIAGPRGAMVDLHQSLREANVPSELTLYPGETIASDETHFFHIPSNQMAAMTENMEWFDFWLKDVPPTSGVGMKRGKSWETMRAAWRIREIGSHAPIRSTDAPSSPLP
jgi:dipeptidyl aminopeptidase/acylaminoacyl peptidase